MSDGMLSFFSSLEDADTQAIIDTLIEDGKVRVVDPGPPPSYALTEDGVKYVEQEIFPQLGVTPLEALAWLDERLGRSSDG